MSEREARHIPGFDPNFKNATKWNHPKKKSALNTIIDVITEQFKSSKEEAAECLLRSLFFKI